MMHAQKNIKLCDAKQAEQVYHYKNIRLKLYKNNAAIWFNKTYKAKHLTPTYANLSNTRPLTCLQTDNTICCMYTTVSS